MNHFAALHRFSLQALLGGILSLTLIVSARSENSSGQVSELERGILAKPFEVEEKTADSQFEWKLREALCLGEFDADSIEDALSHAYIEEKKIEPSEGTITADHEWALFQNQYMFRASEMPLEKRGAPHFAFYLSFWIHTTKSIQGDEHLSILLLPCSKEKMFLNGREMEPNDSSVGTDFRGIVNYRNVELKKGWNHFLIKLAGGRDDIAGVQQKASLVFLMHNEDRDLLSKLTSAVSLKPEKSD